MLEHQHEREFTELQEIDPVNQRLIKRTGTNAELPVFASVLKGYPLCIKGGLIIFGSQKRRNAVMHIKVRITTNPAYVR